MYSLSAIYSIFKYLCVGDVLFCPESISGSPAFLSHPPPSLPLAYWSTQRGVCGTARHSCVFRDHHVSLLNIYLEILSRKKKKKAEMKAHFQ